MGITAGTITHEAAAPGLAAAIARVKAADGGGDPIIDKLSVESLIAEPVEKLQHHISDRASQRRANALAASLGNDATAVARHTARRAPGAGLLFNMGTRSAAHRLSNPAWRAAASLASSLPLPRGLAEVATHGVCAGCNRAYADHRHHVGTCDKLQTNRSDCSAVIVSILLTFLRCVAAARAGYSVKAGRSVEGRLPRVPDHPGYRRKGVPTGTVDDIGLLNLQPRNNAVVNLSLDVMVASLEATIVRHETDKTPYYPDSNIKRGEDAKDKRYRVQGGFVLDAEMTGSTAQFVALVFDDSGGIGEAARELIKGVARRSYPQPLLPGGKRDDRYNMAGPAVQRVTLAIAYALHSARANALLRLSRFAAHEKALAGALCADGNPHRRGPARPAASPAGAHVGRGAGPRVTRADMANTLRAHLLAPLRAPGASLEAASRPTWPPPTTAPKAPPPTTNNKNNGGGGAHHQGRHAHSNRPPGGCRRRGQGGDTQGRRPQAQRGTRQADHRRGIQVGAMVGRGRQPPQEGGAPRQRAEPPRRRRARL